MFRLKRFRLKLNGSRYLFNPQLLYTRKLGRYENMPLNKLLLDRCLLDVNYESSPGDDCLLLLALEA